MGASPSCGRDSAETCLHNTAAVVSSGHVTEYTKRVVAIKIKDQMHTFLHNIVLST